jgi:hypothetical protein
VSRPNYLGLVLPLLCLTSIVMFILACTSKEGFVGTYHAQENGTAGETEAFLELKETGEGSWRVEENEVFFLWHVKGDELRFNTKNGGVIVGKVRGNTIEATLPGDRTIVFKKSP